MTVDPMHALLEERFSQNQWWKSPETLALEDTDLLCGMRRRALSEALAGIDDDKLEVA
jgi:hypothetical protein